MMKVRLHYGGYIPDSTVMNHDIIKRRTTALVFLTLTIKKDALYRLWFLKRYKFNKIELKIIFLFSRKKTRWESGKWLNKNFNNCFLDEITRFIAGKFCLCSNGFATNDCHAFLSSWTCRTWTTLYWCDKQSSYFWSRFCRQLDHKGWDLFHLNHILHLRL